MMESRVRGNIGQACARCMNPDFHAATCDSPSASPAMEVHNLRVSPPASIERQPSAAEGSSYLQPGSTQGQALQHGAGGHRQLRQLAQIKRGIAQLLAHLQVQHPAAGWSLMPQACICAQVEGAVQFLWLVLYASSEQA